MAPIFPAVSTPDELRDFSRRLQAIVLFLGLLVMQHGALAQSASGNTVVPETLATSTELFLMPGSDFVRPGLEPRVNLNIGIGHSFDALKKSPVGNELTFAYTYENAGSHSFWHTEYGSHTETFGVMRNFSLPGASRLGAYTWMQGGLTSLTGATTVWNRFYDG